MKAICIGRNYGEHIRELGNNVPEQPVIFMKNEENIIQNSSIKIPDFTDDLHYECELVFRFNQDVSKDFSGKWTDVISEVTLGIDLTARDVQSYLKSNSLPWELAKNFRNSAIIGEFLLLENVCVENESLTFDFYVNDELRQHGDMHYMIYTVDDIIRFVVNYMDIRKGDLLFTGTPKGVGKVHSNDVFLGKIKNNVVLKCYAE